MCLHLYISMYQSLNLHVFLFVPVSFCVSLWLRLYMPVCVCLPACLSVAFYEDVCDSVLCTSDFVLSSVHNLSLTVHNIGRTFVTIWHWQHFHVMADMVSEGFSTSSVFSFSDLRPGRDPACRAVPDSIYPLPPSTPPAEWGSTRTALCTYTCINLWVEPQQTLIWKECLEPHPSFLFPVPFSLFPIPASVSAQSEKSSDKARRWMSGFRPSGFRSRAACCPLSWQQISS